MGLASEFLQSAHVLFLIAGYFRKEEVKGGQDPTSIENVFCLETIKCLPVWQTPSSGECPLRPEQNNDYCTSPSLSLWSYWSSGQKNTNGSNTTALTVSQRFHSTVMVKAVVALYKLALNCI